MNSMTAVVVERKVIRAQFQVPKAMTRHCVEIKQSGFRVETGCRPVGATHCGALYQRSIQLRLFCRVRVGTAIRTDAGRPVHRDKWSRQQIFSGFAIEDEEISVAASLSE